MARSHVKMLLTLLMVADSALWSSLSYSQSNDSSDTANTQIMLDDSLFLSTRAAGMAGAISTSAESSDSFYYNPAGIGGLHNEGKTPLIRQLHFINAGGAVNENTKSLNSEMTSAGGDANAVVASAVIDANEGKRQYARASVFPNVVFSRVMVGMIADTQLAGQAVGNQSDLVCMNYRTISGPFFGFSGASKKGDFYFGLSVAAISRTDIKGEFLFQDMINAENRATAFAEKKVKYTASPANAGMIWRVSKFAGTPTLAIAARNVGDTFYTPRTDTCGTGTCETIRVNQDLTLGFSVTPRLGNWGTLSLNLEGTKLTDQEISVNKKFRSSFELLLGGKGKHHVFALRGGYNLAGASGGVSINIGLLGFQVATHAEDIGIGNQHVVERRNSATVTVNLAEY